MKHSFMWALPVLLCSQLATAQPDKTVRPVNATVVNLNATVSFPIKLNQPINTPPDLSNVKGCIDRVITVGTMPERNFAAVKPPQKINSDGTISNVAVVRQPLAAETNKMWDPGQTITVFISSVNSTDKVRNKVKQYANEWTRYANIRFQFVTDFYAAQIKVEFATDSKSWSWVGKDVLFNPLGFYTMHYGWLTDQTDESEYRRVIQHEFGHALGFIHEHQSPAGGINWDREKVYTYFGGAPNNWSRADVDRNIFQKYSATSTNFSAYDPASIMHYDFPAELTTDGRGVSVNTDFSATDKSYARQLYPFPPVPGSATGTLRTGDDCDMIDFTVEYNQVPADKIEFVLSGGQMNGKKVTWWKQIGIPLTNGQERNIAAENGSVGITQVGVGELRTGSGISFWKGKFLGVHTQLGYRWDVLTALPGGCRVRLVWKNDTCN